MFVTLGWVLLACLPLFSPVSRQWQPPPAVECQSRKN